MTAADAIDVVGEDFFTDPHAYHERWRAGGPVHRVVLPEGWSGWVIIGYSEARAALSDPRLSRSPSLIKDAVEAKGGTAYVGDASNILTAHMLATDPPDHTRLRHLVSKEFTSRRIAELRPRIEQITATLVDAMASHADQPIDLIEEFAFPLPVTVICELLGVPFADRDRFRAWSHTLVGGPGTIEDRQAAGFAMATFLQELIAAKRANPGIDLLSALAAQSDGDRLTELELLSMAFLLLVAGHETTVNLITNGTYALLRDRDQFTQLLADPASHAPAAVEELLRHSGPVNWALTRVTTAPLTIGDKEIPAGEIVFIALSAANRDPARFASPELVDIDRDTGGHLAFGHGIHYCLGAPLARLEGQIAFTALLQRFPDITLAEETFEPRWRPGFLIHGMENLPVRLTKR
ncbi:MAG: cytochrome P450 [Nocardiaceae bacterium]|nr:cytochrome P450 [Nocardiaceae bacterium]